MGANRIGHVSIACLLIAQLIAISAQQQLTPDQLAAASTNNLIIDGNNLQPQPQQQPMPGYYEFEVAPKMEPPSVKRQQYKHSAQICPGSSKYTSHLFT